MAIEFARNRTDGISLSVFGVSSWIYAFIFCRTGMVSPLVTIPVITTVVAYEKQVVGSAISVTPSIMEVGRAYG